MAAIEWTQEQEAIIARLWPDTSNTIEEIAKACGVGRTSIYRKAMLMGLPNRGRERMTPEEAQAIVRLHTAGLGYRRIATKVGRTPSSVRALVRYLPSSVVSGEADAVLDQAEAATIHGELCLKEGGFPVAKITPAGTVWEYPAQQVAA